MEKKVIEKLNIKKDKKRERKNKKTVIKKKDNLVDIQLECLKQNIKINYIFYIVAICCLFLLSRYKLINSSFLCVIITFISVSIMGYFSHYVSHHINFSEIYKDHSIIIKKFHILDNCGLKIFNLIDFHREIHHNTRYNKTWKNIIIEFFHNIISQGVGIIIYTKFLNYLDSRTILIWCILYSTAHNINYNLIHPTTHIDHHKNEKTNYGIDIYDIIFGTKYNWNDLENYNHYSFNMIIITGLIIYFTNYVYKKN